jgi:PAS domain S-box-containing protein
MATTGTWDYHVEYRRANWSDELYDLYGVQKSGTSTDLALLFTTMVYPDDLALLNDHFTDTGNLLNTFTHRFIRPDGKLIYLQQTIIKQVIRKKVIQVSGTAQDVTERMEYEQKLLFSEKRFRSLLENASDLIGIIDTAGTYLYAGASTRNVLGYDPAYFIGKNTFEFIHPEDVPKLQGKLPLIAQQKIVEFDPFRFLAANGEWRWLESTLTNLLDDPAIGGLVINSRDVTEKKIIRDEMAGLSRIVEDTTNAVVITDENEKITWVNPAFTRISGYTFQEVRGKRPGDFLKGPDTDQATVALMAQCIREARNFDVDVLNYSKDKKYYWVNIHCQPQKNERGIVCGYFAIQTDITERKKLQHQLTEEVKKRQKKITAAIVNALEKERNEIGQELHDNVNQILSTVKLYLGMFDDPTLSKDELVLKSTELVQDCIEEIRQLSKRLTIPSTRELSLKETIKDLIDSIAVASSIDFVFKPSYLERCVPPETVQLAIYRIIQEQLTNILKHAKATRVELSLAFVSNTLSLTITDNGVGFHVPQKRTGIGISNMHDRAIAVDGKIEIHSTPGNGCTLFGYFPLKVEDQS